MLTEVADLEPLTFNEPKMIIRKILRDPMVRINGAAGTGNEQYYMDAIADLFKLETIGETRNSERKNNYRYAQQ